MTDLMGSRDVPQRAAPGGSVGPRGDGDDRLPPFLDDKRVRWVMAAVTLVLGFSVLVLVPAHRFSPTEGIWISAAAASTVIVAVGWLLTPRWPPHAVLVAFTVYADASVLLVLLAFEGRFVALPVSALLCLVGVFAAVCGSGRLLAGHLLVSLTALGWVAVSALSEGNDVWLIASRVITLATLNVAPVLLHRYVGGLRRRAMDALRDPLTGLWNRRGLYDVLDAPDALSTGRDAGSVLGVILIDVDRFKLLNDRFGHRSGDEVLCEVARRLVGAGLERTLVARLGGDEFVCVHRGSAASVAVVEERTRAVLRAPVDGPEFTVSVGSAADAVLDDEPISTVVRRLVAVADLEMYRAKQRPATDARFSASDADTSPAGLAAIRERVRALVESGGPEMVFQPIRDTASGTTVGFEALARFPEASGSPAAWFRDATLAGVAQELEMAALQRALDAMAALPAGAFVSFNVSAEPIRTGDALARLRPHLGSRPLWLELTEHQRIDDVGPLVPMVADLRRAGVRLVIDDVGAGFANLRRVVDLRPDVLKIDRDLTSGMDVDDVRRAATTAVIGFAHAVGASVVVEGVETTGELRVAEQLGAEFVQGYLHGRPAPVQAVALPAET